MNIPYYTDKLKDIRVKEGTMVNAGEVIAKVAEPTSYYTLEGTNLYFQMEKDKKKCRPFKISGIK